jgi:hypothetical protein
VSAAFCDQCVFESNPLRISVRVLCSDAVAMGFRYVHLWLLMPSNSRVAGEHDTLARIVKHMAPCWMDSVVRFILPAKAYVYFALLPNP